MAVPRTIRHHGIVALLIAPAAMIALSAVVAPVLAQSRLGATDGQQPLGGTVGPRSQVPPAQAPSVQTWDDPHKSRSDLTAARLLASARKDISEARPEVAQRVLELLIARYPDSPVATEARRELYALYADDRRIAVSPPGNARPSTDQISGRQGTSTGRQSTDNPPPTPPTRGRVEPPVSPWRTSVVSFRRLQDELRNTVGDRIFFSAGSADLGSRARILIAAQAEWLQRRPDVEVIVEGHADDAGSGADDEQISASRASAVRDRLVAEGVPPDRIRLVTHGARDPIAICSESDCAAQNRRAVLQIGLRRSQVDGNPNVSNQARGMPVDNQR